MICINQQRFIKCYYLELENNIVGIICDNKMIITVCDRPISLLMTGVVWNSEYNDYYYMGMANEMAATL